MSTVTTTAVVDTDLEISLPQPHDPYRLSSALKSPAEISEIAKNSKTTHQRVPFHERILPNYHKRRRRSSGGSGTQPKPDVKGLRAFYERQNNYIQYVLKSVDDHRSEARDEQGDTRLRFLIAVHGSLIANLLLAGLQLYAAISSGSLSLFASMCSPPPAGRVGVLHTHGWR